MPDTMVSDSYGSPPPRCVLWHSGDAPLPGELLSSLTKRIGRVTVCTEAFAALAEACLIHQQHRRAVGHEAAAQPATLSRHAGVLLLVHPKSLVDAAAVLEGAELYAPSLLRWMYDRSANPKLSSIVSMDMVSAQVHTGRGMLAEAAQPPVVVVPRPKLGGVAEPARTGLTSDEHSSVQSFVKPGGSAGPQLRLVAGPAEPAVDLARVRNKAATPLLSEDELRMLLSDSGWGGGGGGGAASPTAGKRPGGEA